jgi:hypothetical protein
MTEVEGMKRKVVDHDRSDAGAVVDRTLKAPASLLGLPPRPPAPVAQVSLVRASSVVCGMSVVSVL